MFPLVGLLLGALSGLLVSALADVLVVAATAPEEVWTACVAADSGRWGFWRCRLLTWRYGFHQTGRLWRRQGWRQPRLWLTVTLLAALGYWLTQTPTSWGFMPLLLSAAFFALVAVVDAETHLVPYEEALLGLLLGLSVGVPRHGLLGTLTGVLGGALVMGLLYWAGEIYTRWQARRRGEPPQDEPALGFGDVYLSGVLGAFLGWPGVLAALTLGALLMGGFILLLGLALLLRQRSLRGFGSRFLPMGPFLVMATFWLMVTA